MELIQYSHRRHDNTAKYWDLAQTLPEQLTPEQIHAQNAMIACELGILSVAFPVQSRNFSQKEVEMTGKLWTELFSRVDPLIFHEAVSHFILSDRKGFFPSPGLIAGEVLAIVKRKESERLMALDFEILQKTMEHYKSNQPECIESKEDTEC